MKTPGELPVGGRRDMSHLSHVGVDVMSGDKVLP